MPLVAISFGPNSLHESGALRQLDHGGLRKALAIHALQRPGFLA